MNTQTWNNLMNNTESDFNYADSITLDTALEMVEFQESLNWEDVCEAITEEM